MTKDIQVQNIKTKTKTELKIKPFNYITRNIERFRHIESKIIHLTMTSRKD